MKVLDRFDVTFEGGIIIFKSKIHGQHTAVTMKESKEDLEFTIKYDSARLFRIESSFYRNRIDDCRFLLEHIEEVNNLIIKHIL